MTGRENLAIVSFIAGCQSRESVFMVLSKRIVGAKQKKSIYSQKPLNCYAVGESKILAFPIESIQNPVS